MKINLLLPFTVMLLSLIVPSLVPAAEHTIKAGPRAFENNIIYVALGDKVQFSNMNTHNSVSVEELIPEGASSWSSALGENISLKFDIPGIYSYVCQPHIGFGMVGIIIVGDVTADDIAAYKQKAIDVLKGPYRRLLGKINKIKPTI